MTRRTSLWLGAAALTAACTPVPPVTVSAPVVVAPSVPTADVSEFSAAGVPVIFKSVRANDVVAVRLYLKGGSANLSAATAGIESFIADLGERGTEKYDKDTFTALATRTGTSIGGSAAYDYSVFVAQGVRQHWDTMWDLFTQATLQPTLPPAEVEIVRGQLLNAIRQQQDDPDSYLSLLGDSVVYAGHAYAALPSGTATSVAALTRDQLNEWRRTRMTKENLLVVVVGNVSRVDLENKIAASFGQLPERGGTAVTLRPLVPITKDVLIIERQLPTNYIAGYYAAPAPSEADYPAFRVASSILSNRLFEEVRTKRNLSYAVAARLFDRRSNVGQIYVTAVNPDTTLRVMLAEVRRLQTEPVPADIVGERVSVLVTQYWLGQETNMNQAAQLGIFELVGGGWENLYTYANRLRAVTPANIQRVAQQYMRNARFVVIGDPTKIPRELFTSL
jgi:zinc protease